MTKCTHFENIFIKQFTAYCVVTPVPLQGHIINSALYDIYIYKYVREQRDKMPLWFHPG